MTLLEKLDPAVVDCESMSGASPVTVTSAVVERLSWRFAVAMASSATVAFFCTVPNPARVAVTV
jgi:hypothetical protein